MTLKKDTVEPKGHKAKLFHDIGSSRIAKKNAEKIFAERLETLHNQSSLFEDRRDPFPGCSPSGPAKHPHGFEQLHFELFSWGGKHEKIEAFYFSQKVDNFVDKTC